MRPLTQPHASTSRSRASSTASLPTPPTTIRKRARSDSDDEDRSEVEQGGAHKRQRVWRTPERPSKRATCNGIAVERDPSLAFPSPPSSDPVLPPASPIRHTSACPTSPRTPPSRKQPIRDTPNNIFVSSPPAAAASESTQYNNGLPDARGEAPTMVYLFRGARQIFANPFYNCMTDPRAKLTPRHPDFSPTGLFPPRRLFTSPEDEDLFEDSDTEKLTAPTARLLTARSLEAAFRRAVNGGDDDDDEVEVEDWEYQSDNEYEDESGIPCNDLDPVEQAGVGAGRAIEQE